MFNLEIFYRDGILVDRDYIWWVGVVDPAFFVVRRVEGGGSGEEREEKKQKG